MIYLDSAATTLRKPPSVARAPAGSIIGDRAKAAVAALAAAGISRL